MQLLLTAQQEPGGAQDKQSAPVRPTNSTDELHEVQQYLWPGGICSKAPLPITGPQHAPDERVDKLVCFPVDLSTAALSRNCHESRGGSGLGQSPPCLVLAPRRLSRPEPLAREACFLPCTTF